MLPVDLTSSKANRLDCNWWKGFGQHWVRLLTMREADYIQ